MATGGVASASNAAITHRFISSLTAARGSMAGASAVSTPSVTQSPLKIRLTFDSKRKKLTHGDLLTLKCDSNDI
jgi:hypothetical protein